MFHNQQLGAESEPFLIEQKAVGSRLKRRFTRQAGFTLIEMAVVIVIISVVAVLVLPRLPFAHERDLKTSARTLAASLRYLGDLAISTKQHYRLHITLLNNEIAVTRVIPEGDELAVHDDALNQLSLLDGIEFSDIVTPRLGKVVDGEAVLDFGPTGVEDFAVIHLKRKDDSHYYTVAIYPGSGRVTVMEGYEAGTLPEGDEEEGR